MAETYVFSDTYLRQYIFQFLRSQPFARCNVCRRTIMWNPQQKSCDYVRLYNDIFYCIICARIEMPRIDCSIT